MEQDDIGWQAYSKKWINLKSSNEDGTNNSELLEHFKFLINRVIDPLFKERKKKDDIVEFPDI